MAHHRQNSSSFRNDVADSNNNQHALSPPLFSASSDNTITNSSTLSSKSSISDITSNNTASASASHNMSTVTPCNKDKTKHSSSSNNNNNRRKQMAQDIHNRALSKRALLENDSMVYLDGPQVYTCGNCRTHVTSHDDIISKSFHGRHGRAYLFDQCVNITTGPPEDRFLITGLHSVSDIFCKRCQTLIGWTYAKAYEQSQKYKEGKYIIEKIHLHLEESEYYTVSHPAGERNDKFRVRSMSWGSEHNGSMKVGSYGDAASSARMGSPVMMGSSPVGGGYYSRGRSGSVGGVDQTSSLSPASYNRPPQTPPTRRSQAMATPLSPRSPSDIIYEYRQNDD